MPFPTYGEFLLSGHAGNPGTAVKRTEMEGGLAKQKQVRSRTAVVKTVTILFTPTEFVSFQTWFRGTECQWGAGWSDWVDPVDGSTKSVRIFNGEYTYNAISQGEGAEIAYEVNMRLEMMEG